jgi:hypothetical protein
LKKIEVVRGKREWREIIFFERVVFLHADHLKGLHAKIYFLIRTLKRPACENRLIFSCGPLRGSSAKIYFVIRIF